MVKQLDCAQENNTKITRSSRRTWTGQPETDRMSQLCEQVFKPGVKGRGETEPRAPLTGISPAAVRYAYAKAASNKMICPDLHTGHCMILVPDTLPAAQDTRASYHVLASYSLV